MFKDLHSPKLAMALSGQFYRLPTNLCEEPVMFVPVWTEAPITKYWAHAFFVLFGTN
jgi:hypothetical protein